MAGYERQIATAKRLIAKRGQAVFWNVRPVATADSSEVAGASKWRPKAAPLQPQLSFNWIFISCMFLFPNIFKLLYNVTFYVNRQSIYIY